MFQDHFVFCKSFSYGTRVGCALTECHYSTVASERVVGGREGLNDRNFKALKEPSLLKTI